MTNRDNADGRQLERHTGADSLLKFGGHEIPVTDVSWSRSHNQEEVQHNGSLNPTLATTDVRYSGSFEYNGQNPEVLEAISIDPGAGEGQNRPERASLTLREYESGGDPQEGERVITVTFKRCIATSIDRDNPSDGVSSTSVDWEAEDMFMTKH